MPHLAADVGENLVPVVQLHPEHRVRQRLDDRPSTSMAPSFLGMSSAFRYPAPPRALPHARRCIATYPEWDA